MLTHIFVSVSDVVGCQSTHAIADIYVYTRADVPCTPPQACGVLCSCANPPVALRLWRSPLRRHRALPGRFGHRRTAPCRCSALEFFVDWGF